VGEVAGSHGVVCPSCGRSEDASYHAGESSLLLGLLWRGFSRVGISIASSAPVLWRVAFGLCGRLPSVQAQMAITAEVAEDVAAKAAAAAKRKPGAARDARRRGSGAAVQAGGGGGSTAAAPDKSPVFSLYERLAQLFRDTYGVVCGLRGAPLPGYNDAGGADAAEDKAAVAAAWAPIERRLQQLALAGERFTGPTCKALAFAAANNVAPGSLTRACCCRLCC
jgi:hypothetical protein